MRNKNESDTRPEPPSQLHPGRGLVKGWQSTLYHLAKAGKQNFKNF